MLDDELRRLTASEPLSLEEEYEMQRKYHGPAADDEAHYLFRTLEKWLHDEDKLTFIILSKTDDFNPTNEGTITPLDPRIGLLPMVGDVNIFLHGSRRAGDSPEENDHEGHDFEAEVEIMIAGKEHTPTFNSDCSSRLAEPAYRRRGFAYEALQLMLSYVTGISQLFSVNKDHRSIPSPLHVPAARLITRITESNEPSIKLFEKLGFKITKRVAIFEEVEMRWSADTILPEYSG